MFLNSIENKEQFWAEQAEKIQWFKKPQNILSEGEVHKALEVWRSIFLSKFSAAYYVLSILRHVEHYMFIMLGIVIYRETPTSGYVA